MWRFCGLAVTDPARAVFVLIRRAVSGLWYKVSLPRIPVLILVAVFAALTALLRLATPPTTVHPTTNAKPPHVVVSKTPPEGKAPTATPGPSSSLESLRKTHECVSQPLPVVTLAHTGNRSGSVELVIGAVAVCVGVNDMP